MPQSRTGDPEAYCFLRQHLEPRFLVTAEPSASYFSEWQYCYRIFDGDRLRHELQGDIRTDAPGKLWTAARKVVAALADEAGRVEERAPQSAGAAASFPIASRLPPDQTDTTYFSSGRAAFAYLVGTVIRPRSVYLPTFVCWSLISAMQRRFPDVELRFYSVDQQLNCRFPDAPDNASALVFIHYFGHRATAPASTSVEHVAMLEDRSHLPLSGEQCTGDYAFGSLRKVYRAADGGFLLGRFNPVYEPAAKADTWLRLQARDWKDMREAENMTDRDWPITDISSQSLAVVLSADHATIKQRRLAHNRFLESHLSAGRPLLRFGQDDCPLLHNRVLETREERDELRSFLASRGVFCSIHWPVHPLLQERQDEVDVTDAIWLADHCLSIPLSERFGERELEAICTACDDWMRSGG